MQTAAIDWGQVPHEETDFVNFSFCDCLSNSVLCKGTAPGILGNLDCLFLLVSRVLLDSQDVFIFLNKIPQTDI